MSWQRILRFAKQRQVPVIITDESGEEPLILLSLDQLEQALDGGAAPDLPPAPPAPPAPRPTTPSFVPEPAISPEAVPFEPAPVPEAATPTDPPSGTHLPAALSTFAELEEAAHRATAPAIDIVTPPVPEPAPSGSEPPIAAPEAQAPAASQVPPVPATPGTGSGPQAPSARPDLSLEERFFLDF